MRIVYVCQWNPWTLNGGALIRNAWLVRALGSRYPVDLVTAGDPSSEVPEDFRGACASIWRFPRAAGAPARMRHLLEGLRPRSSFFTSGAVSARLRQKVSELLAVDGAVAMFDLKMLDALDGTSAPFVYNAHNAEHRLFARRAEREPQPVRGFLRTESSRIGRIETRIVRGARLVTACSENDRRELLELVPEAASKIVVVPNGVDTQRYGTIAHIPGHERTILISGSYDWRPNIIGLEWFLTQVLPRLREHMAARSYEIRIAGRMRPELAAALAGHPNVTAVANPPDMLHELQRAQIVAAPIIASSGTRLRILEAWAAGRPVVTTAAGALGLDYENGRDLIAADRPEDFAAAICRVLDDGALWRCIQERALLRAREYDWNTIGCTFIEQTAQILDERQRAPRLLSLAD